MCSEYFSVTSHGYCSIIITNDMMIKMILVEKIIASCMLMTENLLVLVSKKSVARYVCQLLFNVIKYM